ncbi:putative aminopeptidase-2 isoform X1 [Mya arenaria]|uniref:putative aminopeptidase-2 isoform X1 n=1 Tax=Mya arenaria TaxID=6604 RepID=UPI0022DF99F5|nr:putative aminopeptidase-2 isoform X1 [Mya arenaria]
MSKYKFSDAVNGEGTSGAMGSGKGDGCYVKTATGFLIGFFAITIAVGVGLIVHFAENRKIECVFPDQTSVNGGSNAQAVQCPEPPTPTPCPVCADKICPTCPAQNPLTSRACPPCPTQPTSGPLPTATTRTPPPVTAKPTRSVRLPTDLIPLHYDLALKPNMYDPDPTKFTFDGTVSINLHCNQQTNKVILHSNMINITSIPQFTGPQGSTLRYSIWEEDKDLQQLVIHLNGYTVKGQNYTLRLQFTGPLTDDLMGFYLSSYKDGNETVYVATTQMEPTDARKAFPCFDEPAMKATFKVTLTRKNTMMSLSNMPLERSVHKADNMVDDIYQTSLQMSTYLLAFVVGQFKNTQGTTSNGLIYGAWARPQSVEQTKVALDVGTQTIVNYENYFDIAFPLPKQDMIAIPDFGLGAMENWGLITYRETAMLYNSVVSSEANKQRVTTVITHELAHQWFGDLVTMDWWDDIWLNEGFATFVEYMGADMIHPDWQMWEQFIYDELHLALELDSLVSSHPIYVPVNDPVEIHEIFDTISYSKGGSVIRMMRYILGEETFRQGLTKYLNSHKYANANHDDLWEALHEQSRIDGKVTDVKGIMDTWTLQMNYPVVMVTTNGSQLRFQQSRFLKNSAANDTGKYPSPFNYRWRIPITYTTSKAPTFAENISYTWLDQEFADVTITPMNDGDWVLVNVNQYGVYRVNYAASNWNALVKQLKAKHEVISTINRAQIINDAWSLSKAGQLSTEIALSTLEYLDQEMDYVVWAAAEDQITYLDDMLKNTDLYGSFKSFMLSKLSGPFQHYGLDDTNATHIESLTRSKIAGLACSYGLQECVNEAVRLFEQWMDNPDRNPIDPDLRLPVYCTAIAEGGSQEWDFAFEMFKSATVATEKVTLSHALACTSEPWLLSRYLELSITPEVVRKQDATKVLVYIGQNPIGQLLTWDFVRGEWDYLQNTYGKGVFSFTSLIRGLTSSFNTEFQLSQLQQFQMQHPDMGTGNRAFQQAMENTETNIKWMALNKNAISSWLDNVGVTLETRVKDVRLPTHLVPDLYDIVLQPNMYSGDPESFTFDGYVKIHMTANSTGRNVTVHANKLNIQEGSIKFGKKDGSSGPSYRNLRETDKQRQFEIFFLDQDVIAGQEYFIEMNFTGPLIGDLAGLYLSQYKRGNETVYIATSQMEPTDARKSFPCFDEPNIKAKFNVKLVRHSSMKSISNMPIISNFTLGDGMVVDVFDTSAKMSTYLLAFIVCDFEYIEGKTAKGTRYRAWARPESIEQAKVALEVGVKILSHYEDYFGEDFPLPKQDMIAVPDFSAGAMENWGLITYRETAMLYEPGVSSEGNLQRVNVVIAHELAHQWFGDLVTMDWWDDLWLNEGFASFVEYMGTDFVHPDWKMFEQFINEDLHRVFDIDSLVTSHPIYVPVSHPDEINEIFDGISYSKGGSVIRMMRFFLGEETFKKGLQLYIDNRKYQNAFHDDLWLALERQANNEGKHLKVVDIMNTWILQMNYPVVTISKADSGNIIITQERFLKNKDARDPKKYTSPYGYQWMIPFTFTTSASADFNVTDADVHWLNNKTMQLNSEYPTTGWILGNIQQYGVYRVNYDENNWNELIKQLKDNHTAISTINRAQIINDAFGFAAAKQLPMSIALKTLEYLNTEEEYVPWVAAGDELGFIDSMLKDTELYGPFKRFMREKVDTQFKRIGMNNTGASHLESYLRSEISAHACTYGNQKCIVEALELFRQYMANEGVNPIDPGLKSTVYCTALREGGEEEWNFAFKLYMTATVQAEKSRLLTSLSCTREPWILNKMLTLALDESVVRKQDAYKVFIYVGRNTVGRGLAWDFFRGRWNDIYETYGTGSFSLSDIISGVTASFNTEFHLQQLRDFEKAHSNMGSGTRAFSQTIENTLTNIRWMNENYNIVDTWLGKYKN